MTVLVTVDDDLAVTLADTLQTGPWQLSPTGMPLLAMPSYPFGLGLMAGALPMIGGRMVSFGDIYRSQPNVAAAVNKRYRPILRLPLRVLELDSQNNRRDVWKGPLFDLVQSPWSRGSQAALKIAMFAPTLVHGNSAVGLKREAQGAPPSSFRPLDWRYMSPTILRGEVSEWRYSGTGREEVYEPADVLWLKWWGPDGFGISPLEQLGVTLRIEQAAQRSQEANFLHGGRPPSAIEVGEKFLGLEPEERTKAMENLRSDITTLYTSPENAGRPALLPPDVHWNPVGHTAVEAALIDQRKLSRSECDAVYDIPPPLVGDLEHATYSNITEQSSWLYTNVLGPDLVLTEQEIRAQVLDPEPMFGGQWLEFDFSAVLRGKKLEEIETIREAIGTAVMTPNEGRHEQGRPTEGDVNDPNNPANKLYLPMNNLSPLGATPAAVAAEQVAAAAAAANGNGNG